MDVTDVTCGAAGFGGGCEVLGLRPVTTACDGPVTSPVTSRDGVTGAPPVTPWSEGGSW